MWASNTYPTNSSVPLARSSASLDLVPTPKVLGPRIQLLSGLNFSLGAILEGSPTLVSSCRPVVS